MIRLRLSRRLLRRGGLAVGVVALLVACYILGDRLTPRDGSGRPLLLSPSVRAAERYRRAALQWTAGMAEIDHRLTALLVQQEVTDPAQLYNLSQETQDVMDRAIDLWQDVAFTPAPPALLGLAEQAQVAAEAHLEAARTAARWVGAPEANGRRAALESLRLARGLRAQLEAARWLAGFDAPDRDDGR
ncbi:MAG TPA: hypothetical protein ENI39_04190 [Anaerolineae bacterium]|nr:hypothetical protein [Anaerolineae bacterium]